MKRKRGAKKKGKMEKEKGGNGKRKKEEKKRKNVIILSADMLGSSQPFQLLNFEFGSIVYLNFLAEQSSVDVLSSM